MKEILYISESTDRITENDLIDILKVAIANNERLDITGALLFDGIRFMQILEGPDETVDEVFASIQKDERHENIIIFLEAEIESRSFPDWSMGYKYMHPTDEVDWKNWNALVSNFNEPAKFKNMGPRVARMIFSSFLKERVA